MKRCEMENTIYYYPYEESNISVTVYKPETIFGKNGSACVNWCALGNVTPDEAEAYGHALLAASAEAKKLNENFT